MKNEKKSNSGFDGCKPVLDIYKCPISIFGHGPLKKNVKNRVVTVMVSFPKKVEKSCERNFFH